MNQRREEITEEWWNQNINLELDIEDTSWFQTTTDETDNETKETTSNQQTAKFIKYDIRIVSFPQKPRDKVKKQKRVPRNFNRKTVYNMNFDQMQYGERRQKKQPDIPKDEIHQGTWSEDEIERFFIGFETLGRRWKKIALNFVKTRNTVQVACFGQKYVKSLE